MLAYSTFLPMTWAVEMTLPVLKEDFIALFNGKGLKCWEGDNLYVNENTGDVYWRLRDKTSFSDSRYVGHKFQVLDINEDDKIDIIREGCGYKIISYCEKQSVSAVNYEDELPGTNEKYVGTIRNDTVWRDIHDNEIWCNGGHMISEGDTFYWVGYETKPRMGLGNIKLYSSANLADWKFENNILRNEGPQSILTWAGRPALLYNRRTGKYVLVFEASSKQWHRHKVGFASCRTIRGEYKLQAYQYPQDERSTGDQSVYQEGDSAYLVSVLDHPDRESVNHSLAIYKLSPDFLSVGSKVFEGFRNCRREAPHIIKRENQYYWFTSGLEYWNSTATMYATAPALSGPWSELKVLSTEPVSIDSFNTQHDFIIPIVGSEATTYVYVGDRYSQHHGHGIGRNIFLPLIWENEVPKLRWFSAWGIDLFKGTYNESQPSHGRPTQKQNM